MSWRTLLVLVLAVAGLAYYALRTEESATRAEADREFALFPGLDENLVVAVRIENLRRDLHMRFERDAKGEWDVTDPVVSRAENVLLDSIVQAAARARGTPVADDEARDAGKLGLEPPRFVLDVESTVDGTNRRRSVEFGAVELDGARWFARADGRVVRVSRELEPLLDMQLHELRATTVSRVDPRAVLEIRRSGSAPLEADGPLVDAAFEAIKEGGAWRATSPVTGALDPATMTLYVQSFAVYRYDLVVDEGSRAPSALGLDPPEVSLRFGTIGTETVDLVFGRSGEQRRGRWLGTRVGSSVVWEFPSTDVGFLALPVEDMLDHKLVRARRGSIVRLDVESSAGSVKLARGAKGWTCSIARAGSRVYGPPEAAEARAVEDALGELERYELAGFVRGATFDAGPSPVRWSIGSDDGAETGGTFGGAYVDASGASDALFQRAGETAVAHGDPTIARRLTRDPETWLSLKLLDTIEADLSAVVVRGAAGERRYERNAKGIWTHPGGDVEARELRDVLEGLLFVRATERVPESARMPLQERVDVDLESAGRVRARIAVGMTGVAGVRRAEVEVDGKRGVIADAAMHAKLAALLSAR